MAEKTVEAKAKAAGSGTYHPEAGILREGEVYQIPESLWSDDLFERPEGFVPPWEREDLSPEKQKNKKVKGGTE